MGDQPKPGSEEWQKRLNEEIERHDEEVREEQGQGITVEDDE